MSTMTNNQVNLLTKNAGLQLTPTISPKSLKIPINV